MSTVRKRIKQIEPILQHEGFAFTFAFIYVIINVLYFFVGAAPEWRLAINTSTYIRVVRATARGSGSILNLNSALIIFVASKIFFSILRRTPLNMVVPFDKAMPDFHALIGSTTAIAALVHTLCHLINYGVQDLTTKGVHGHICLAITGTILFICLGLIRLTSVKSIKDYVGYETWYLCHIIGMIVYFSILIVHGSHHGKFSSYKFVAAPLTLYVIDIFFRRLRSRSRVVLIPAHTAKTIGPKIIKLHIKREPTFQYLAGQYCYINVPQISYWQWHPFSIASSPHENYLTFYIKVAGDWTSQLYSICSTDATTEPFPRNFPVYIRGPFGAPAQHVGQYEHVILISGGVGATPFTSITKFAYNYLMNHSSQARRYLKSPHAAFQFNYGAHTANAASIIPKGVRPSRFVRKRKDEHPEGEVENSPHPAAGVDEPPWAPEWEEAKSRDATLLSKARGAANSTFYAMGRTLRNALFLADYDDALGDPTQPIPARHTRTVSDFSHVDNQDFDHNDEDEMLRQAKIWEDQLIREAIETPSMAWQAVGRDMNAPYPYRNVGVEKSSDINSLILPTGTWKDKAIVVLHSVTLNWLLLWMMLLRFAVVGVGRITGGFVINHRGLSIYANTGLNVIDLGLSIILMIPVVLTLLSEIASYGLLGFFELDYGNVFDFILYTPLALLCVILHSLGLAGIGKSSHHVAKVLVLGVWPVLSAFLLWRIIRTIGSRVTLAQFLRSRVARTKSLDFLLVNKTRLDDEWMMDELLPIASSGPVRIHRFLTRESENRMKEKWKKNYIEPPIITTYERPDWNKVFLNLVEKSPSGTVIGVFFCGGHKMQRYVQEAALNAMQKSIKNSIERAYDPARYRNRDRDNAVDANEEEDEAMFGCSVRISVRAENFS